MSLQAHESTESWKSVSFCRTEIKTLVGIVLYKKTMLRTLNVYRSYIFILTMTDGMTGTEPS